MHIKKNKDNEAMEENKPMEMVQIEGESYYKISRVNEMRPFFMTIVSDSNHWLFLSSNGGVSAGRKNSEYALFPYYTDDKITESAEHTGCKTLIRVTKDDHHRIWEPFSIRSETMFDFERNLYKNRLGNKIIFEEINHTLGITFSYQWNSSNQYGFVRKASLINHLGFPLEIAIVDGFQNLLPYGVESDLQRAASNLADAYKRSELIPQSGLGVFALSAIIVDKAEPSEALKANTVWLHGLEHPHFLLSTLQLERFRAGIPLSQEEDIKGEKGAFLVHSQFNLVGGGSKNWQLVANVNQTQSDVIQLAHLLRTQPGFWMQVQQDIESGSKNLLALAGAADAIQLSSDDRLNTRHFANVLFNIMRGGIFDNNYQITKSDFIQYLRKANKALFFEVESCFTDLPETFSLFKLKEVAHQSGHPALVRLATEYLPLKFSRRHGDPSRPWNKFSINTRSELDGSKILDYEGNWRDIFQNWEALAHAYPEFIEGMIFKFLNASTFDGYNPYRVTKGGFDWETIEPDNPWSYIGYWGDHQIIYLLKLLELAQSHHPEHFSAWLKRDDLVYAHVPYQIKPYEQILADPKNTIEFDHAADTLLRQRMEEVGADGTLLTNQHGVICLAGFCEKILATVLAKVSNLVLEGGIWMNTQRPEWNDANNALVGNGLSMVTVCYLRRFLSFFLPVFESNQEFQVSVSAEISRFFHQVEEGLNKHLLLLNGQVKGEDRKHLTDTLAIAGSDFRTRIYRSGFTGEKVAISLKKVADFFRIANQFLEHSIAANRRTDGLYHTYNLISITPQTIGIDHLNEMLEGQVAVLSSGFLSADESLRLLDALRTSALYREDQNSYMLYPNKQLPRFLEKNLVSRSVAERSELLTALLEAGNRQIVEADIDGTLHFNSNFRNATDLSAALSRLDAAYQPLVLREQSLVLEIFESVFNHKAFTGRSGTFFGYEGLGSIYWHMVSKLGLAVQETVLKAIRDNEEDALSAALTRHYYAVQDGIGMHKSPRLYGAFPTDPYSHTPFGKGAQQPGMTGQVKEDVLCRLGELGLEVRNGILAFNPLILKRGQFLTEPCQVEFVDVHGIRNTLHLPEKTLFFTYCQVPIVYELGTQESIEVELADGSKRTSSICQLTHDETKEVFHRTGAVDSITVCFKDLRFRI